MAGKITTGLQNFLTSIQVILSNLYVAFIATLKASLPIAGGLVLSDVLIGTKFGVFERTLDLVSKVGITGNVLTIIIVVGLVLWYNNKK